MNFSRSTSEMELITRKVIAEMEGKNKNYSMEDYTNPESAKYHDMVDRIGQKLCFSSLRYHRLDDMIQSVGIAPDRLCTYCWNGKE